MEKTVELKPSRNVAWQVGIEAGLSGPELETCARIIREPIKIVYNVQKDGTTKMISVNGKKLGK